MRRATLATLLLGMVTAVASPAAAQIAPGGGGSLDAWRLTGVMMVGGGEGNAEAKATWMARCPSIHAAVDDYLNAAPWVTPPEGTEAGMFEPFDHATITEYQTAMVNLWRDAASEPDAAPLEPLTTDFCSTLQTDGWLAVPASIVHLITDPNDLIRVESSGETTCEFGELLVGSASYGYRWDHGDWVYGFGTGWRDVYDNFDATVSSNIDLTCTGLFEPSDIARVAEATPATQVNVNPALRGLTQLDHWLWYDFTNPASYQIGPLTTTVDASGFTWTIETTAWVDQVLWDIDCHTACSYRGMATGFTTSSYDYTLDLPDTPLHPAPTYHGGTETATGAAYTHVYTQLGDVTISAATVWRGSYIITNNLRFGSASFPVTYAPVIVANTHTMPIVSIRTELRNTPPDD